MKLGALRALSSKQVAIELVSEDADIGEESMKLSSNSSVRVSVSVGVVVSGFLLFRCLIPRVISLGIVWVAEGSTSTLPGIAFEKGVKLKAEPNDGVGTVNEDAVAERVLGAGNAKQRAKTNAERDAVAERVLGAGNANRERRPTLNRRTCGESSPCRRR